MTFLTSPPMAGADSEKGKCRKHRQSREGKGAVHEIGGRQLTPELAGSTVLEPLDPLPEGA
jgi:hypothetical protein